jgi:hypothetical protein
MQVRRGSNKQPFEQLEKATSREIKNDLMVLHALAALDRTQVSHETIMTIAHSSEPAILEH